MPPHQFTAKQTINEHSENELRKKRAQLFDPIKDFRKYQSKYIYSIDYHHRRCCISINSRRNYLISMYSYSPFFIRFHFPLPSPPPCKLCTDSQNSIENGIITQMRAEWILPEDKKLEVTLKELKKDKYLTVSCMDT